MKRNVKRKIQYLADKSAEQINFHSRITCPISDLTFIERSRLFAEVAMIAYLSPAQCNIAAGKLGFTEGDFFDCDGSQAYWFYSEYDSVVVCRGTEPTEWNDIKADANAFTAVAETVGKVHRGFKKEVDDLWPLIEESLAKNKLPLWFSGHSLGGAMAKICACRCQLSDIPSSPQELYTYGSPRVGDREYVNHVPIKHYRWVNNNDVITRVPPVWLGYHHSGEEVYLNRHGKISPARGWRRFSDRVQGFLSGLRQFRFDQLSDHSIQEYIDKIDAIACEYEF